MGRCSVGVPMWLADDAALAWHAPGGRPRRPYQWRCLSLRARAPEQHCDTCSSANENATSYVLSTLRGTRCRLLSFGARQISPACTHVRQQISCLAPFSERCPFRLPDGTASALHPSAIDDQRSRVAAAGSKLISSLPLSRCGSSAAPLLAYIQHHAAVQPIDIKCYSCKETPTRQLLIGLVWFGLIRDRSPPP